MCAPPNGRFMRAGAVNQRLYQSPYSKPSAASRQRRLESMLGDAWPTPLPTCLSEIVNALHRNGLTELATTLAVARKFNVRQLSATDLFATLKACNNQRTFTSKNFVYKNGRLSTRLHFLRNSHHIVKYRPNRLPFCWHVTPPTEFNVAHPTLDDEFAYHSVLSDFPLPWGYNLNLI